MELSALPFLNRSPDHIKIPTLRSLTAWLDCYNGGYRYDDTRDLFLVDDGYFKLVDRCRSEVDSGFLNGYSDDGFWLPTDRDPPMLVPPSSTLDGGEPLDFLPDVHSLEQIAIDDATMSKPVLSLDR
jgi:hypothetical protein